MKRKHLAVGLSICLAVLTLFSFVGCGKKDPVKEALSKREKIPYVESSVDLHGRVLRLDERVEQVIRSREELLTTINRAITFQEGKQVAWSKYDDEFFKKKSLIVCFGGRNDPNMLRKVAGVITQEQMLTVIYTEKDLEPIAVFDGSWSYYLILEVDKERVEAIETVEIQFIEI